jgi:hypothetical protein
MFLPNIGSYEEYQDQLQDQQPVRDNIGYYNFVIHLDGAESRFYVSGLCSRWIKVLENGSKIIFHFEDETKNYCWYYQLHSRNELIKHNIHSDDPTEVSQTKGFRAWYHMGKIHRWNGEPAIVHHNGRKIYAFLGDLYNTFSSYLEKLMLYCKKQLQYQKEIESCLDFLPNDTTNIIQNYNFEFDISFIQQQYDMFLEEYEKLCFDNSQFEKIPPVAKLPLIYRCRSIFGTKNNETIENIQNVHCVKSLFSYLQNK